MVLLLEMPFSCAVKLFVLMILYRNCSAYPFCYVALRWLLFLIFLHPLVDIIFIVAVYSFVYIIRYSLLVV
jgi:hypothetical protein